MLLPSAMCFLRQRRMDEDCNSYVRFVYDYNLEYIDLFHKQATKMNLYVFDEKGVFVTELKEESGAFAPDYLMTLPGAMAGRRYIFVAWSGLYDKSYDKVTLTPGVSTLEDLEVSVNNLKTRIGGGWSTENSIYCGMANRRRYLHSIIMISPLSLC